MNSAHNTEIEMTTAQAVARMMEVWNHITDHFAAKGLTGEALYQATAEAMRTGYSL